MNLNDADFAKTLECPVCLDVFDEPKLLICGHTVCQKCVDKVVATQQTAANARQGRDGNSIKCPECTKETEIPPNGLPTNYRLVDLVCRAQKSLVDAHACNGCGKKASVAEMFTCETCQEVLNTKPLWICALCAMEQHRYHTTSKCNKATRQQIEETFRLLNQQNRGFVRLQEGVKSTGNELTQEDLAASLQAANDLKQKFTKTSTIASEAGKVFESALRDCREKLEDLFATEQDEESVEKESSGTSRNNVDLGKYDDGQKTIILVGCRIDAIPELSRFSELQMLSFRRNLLTSINDNITHTTLTNLYLNFNKIAEIRGLDELANLEVLSIAYNRLRKIQGLTKLVKLKRIYLKGNTIEKIEGLDTLVNLELLELSENRIKAIESLNSQRNLRSLYLGRNRIRKLENISHLSKLSVLSISGNRIAKLENLDTFVDLEQLYVDGQRVENFDGIQTLNKLKLIDAGKNLIASLDHLDHLQQLECLRLNDNVISQWSEVEKLSNLMKLRNVQMEGNPIATQDRNDYRDKVIQVLEQVTHVDDTPFR